MTTPPTHELREASIDSTVPAPLKSPAQLLLWSVRREFWENRSLYIAPLAAAAVVMLGYLFSLRRLMQKLRMLSTMDAAAQHNLITTPYNVVAGVLFMTSFIVAVYYCLDALHGERRDRSILFWKSMPVSDRTTVLAKASIPLLILPLLIFVIIMTTQFVMLRFSSVILLMNGVSPAPLWSHVRLVPISGAMLYGLLALALWYAPIYAWFLLVSAWARRAPVLWAILPWAAIGIFEQVSTRTSHFQGFLRSRFIGWYSLAFDDKAVGGEMTNPLSYITPGTFLSAPGLWSGLLFAALCLAAAVWLRRKREPI